MTKIIGRPQGYALSVPLKLVLREEVPYRSPEVGISAGTYEATWKNGRWEADGAELNVIMPRFDQPDAMALSNVTVFISRTDTGQQVAKYPYKAGEWAETAPGVLDLQVPAYERRWQTTQSVLKAVENANAAAQNITAATTDLSKEKASLDGFMNGQKVKVDTAISTQKGRVDSAITALGGIRQVTVTPDYVELADVSGTRLEESTHITPNGVVLDTITIIPDTTGGN